ncbi:MAG: YitT family protein [Bacteroidaceae bacterium]|nr:YitT family protein [Bacteroidaceae bacterium]
MPVLPKMHIWDEVKDYMFITLGCMMYCVGFVFFMLPYQFIPGGCTGIAALIYYATGFQTQYSYLAINLVLLVIGLRVLGIKYFVKTIYAVAMITIGLEIVQRIAVQPDGTLMRLAHDDEFMAAVLGGCIEGTGLAIVFLNNGSTGGTDIVASIINKYKSFSMGRIIMWIDFMIVTGGGLLVLHDWHKVVIGYCVLLISMIMVDYTMNSATQSVQFTIISDKHDDIARVISTEVGRGVTVLYGEGYYSKAKRNVLIVMARRRESPQIFRLIRYIDPHAFVSQTKVVGVYGEGFDHIKS